MWRSPTEEAVVRLAALHEAALAPLRFASRQDFAFVSRVQQLARTLQQALQRLQQACQQAQIDVPIASWLQNIPADTAATSERIRALRQLYAQLSSWDPRVAAVGQAASASVAAAPSKPGVPAQTKARLPASLPPASPSPASGRSLSPPPPAVTVPPVAAGPAAASTAAASPTSRPAAPGSTVPPPSATASRSPRAPANPAPSASPAAGRKPRVASKAAAPRAKAATSAAPAAPQGPQTRLDSLRGVGPRMADQLAQRNLHTIADLLQFLPRRFRTRHGHQPIAELRADMVTSIEGQVQAVNERFMRQRRVLEVVLNDGTGGVHLMWFRPPGRSFSEQFVRGARFAASGTVRRYKQFLQIAHPEIRRLEDIGELGHTAMLPLLPHAAGAQAETVDASDDSEDAIVPLYLDVDGMHPNQLRRLIAQVLPHLADWPDPLPQAQRTQRSLCPLGDALLNLHAPPADTEIEALQNCRDPWHRRLIYDELFFLQLGLLKRRQDSGAKERGVVLPADTSMQACAADLLPFAPTGAQQRVLADIGQDLLSGRPMQRLLQGDVGSGKTAVAFTAALAVARAGLQTALMAPTELLAEQHARTARTWFDKHNISTALLTGSTPPKEKRRILAAMADGSLQLVVGTHALIQNDVKFGKLAFAIIDEQHRFGVLQRARLAQLGEAGLAAVPHMLVMTATPIPRTLALTVYSDLEVSIIDELPPGRQPIATRVFRDGERGKVYAQVREQVALGRQAYVVFPLVEESDKEGMDEIRAAKESADELLAGPLQGLRLALLHGRLSGEEKEAVMQAFLRRDVDVLIATTVIEVGIDVANATLMVVEHAERFGLSQLHQLRGRVGRGSHESFCFLLSRNKPSETAWRRLQILAESNDGFRIAEEDLAIRGPGDFVGTRQSGLPMLSLANLSRDAELLAMARADARAVLALDPQLTSAAHAAIVSKLAQQWSDKMKLVEVG